MYSWFVIRYGLKTAFFKISDVVNQLFSHLPADRLRNFSCGHIIPTANLQTLVVTTGPRGRELDYKAGKQGDSAAVCAFDLPPNLIPLILCQIGELGQILLNFSGIVPGGTVVFFPSYNFLNTAKAAWQKSGALDKLSNRKMVS